MPRAKKTETADATDKKTVAKAKKAATTKVERATIAEIVKTQVAEQLQEALLNIEFDVPTTSSQGTSSIDLEEIKKEVRKEIDFEWAKKEHKEKIITNAEAKLERSELTLIGAKEYNITSGLDGLVIGEGGKPLITASKSGAIGFGLRAPRSFGAGSAHFRAVYPSEAPMPTNGAGSTRGVIVEGDGDDDKTFTFRAVSRMNRQGLNVTSDGSLIVGLNDDKTKSRATIYQPNYDEHALNIFTNSKQYANNLVNLTTSSLPSKRFNAISVTTDVEENGKPGIETFKVDGEGSVYTDQSFLSNKTGYAELFEWADGNPKNEDRNGFTVTLTENGQLQIADEGDKILGVISSDAAYIGGAGWSYTNKFFLDDANKTKKQKVKIVEWEDDVGILHSYYLDSLTADFSLPDNATIYETDEEGDEFEVPYVNSEYEKDKEYTDRISRSWAVVLLVGRTTVFKGQFMNPNWIKVSDVNDDLEEWILK